MSFRSRIRKTTCGKHACRRIAERTHLTPEGINTLLDNGCNVPIGINTRGRERSHLIHRLLYSAPDRQWFVAVQDERNNEVLTVLDPLRHGFLVSEEAKQEAKALACGTALPSAPSTADVQPLLLPPKIATLPPSALRFMCFVRTSGNGHLRSINLGGLPIAEFGSDLLAVAENPRVHAVLRERLREKLRDGDEPTVFLVHIGKHEEAGVEFSFRWREP